MKFTILCSGGWFFVAAYEIAIAMLATVGYSKPITGFLNNGITTYSETNET